MSIKTAARTAQFRGWHVLGAGFVNATLLAGSSIYAASLFLRPIEQSFGLSRDQTSFGMIFFYLGMAISAALVGRIFDRFSARQLSIYGGIAFGAGFLLLGFAPHPAVILMAILLPISFGFTATGPFMANALATNWFSHLRGRALGLTAVTTSVGGFLVVPIVSLLLQNFGWRITALVIGSSIGVITILLSRFFIVGKPEEIGQLPDGDSRLENRLEVKPAEMKNLLKKPSFWLIGIAAGLLLGSDQALLANLAAYGEEAGFGAGPAAWLLSVIAGSAIIGKLLVGWLAERYDKRLLFVLVCGCNILFLITLLITPTYGTLIAIAAFVGLAIGGVYPVWTTITAQIFGREHFAAAIGAMNLITVTATIFSLFLTGYTHKLTGNYDLAFKIFVPQVALAALIICFVGLSRKKLG